MGFGVIVPINFAKESDRVDLTSDNLSLASFASSSSASSVSSYQCDSIGRRICSTKLHHTWVLNVGSSTEVRIEVLHSRMTGRKRVLVDGREVFSTRKRHLFWSFRHDSGAEIILRSDSSGFRIQCNEYVSKESTSEHCIKKNSQELTHVLDSLVESGATISEVGHAEVTLNTLLEQEEEEHDSDECEGGQKGSCKSGKVIQLDDVATMVRVPGNQSFASDESTPRYSGSLEIKKSAARQAMDTMSAIPNLREFAHSEPPDMEVTLRHVGFHGNFQSTSPQPSPRNIPEQTSPFQFSPPSCSPCISGLIPGSVDDIAPVTKERARLLQELATKDAHLAMLKKAAEIMKPKSKDNEASLEKPLNHVVAQPSQEGESDCRHYADETRIIDRHLINKFIMDSSNRDSSNPNFYRQSASYSVASDVDWAGQKRLVAEVELSHARRPVAIPVEVVGNRATSLPPVAEPRSKVYAFAKPYVRRANSQPPIAPERAFPWMQKRFPSRHSKIWHADNGEVTCAVPQNRLYQPPVKQFFQCLSPEGGSRCTHVKVAPWMCAPENTGVNTCFTYTGHCNSRWPLFYSAR